MAAVSLFNRLIFCELKNAHYLLSSTASCWQPHNAHKSTATTLNKSLKKPSSGFAKFIMEQTPVIREESKTKNYTNTERFKRLSEMWNTLSAEEKKAYKAPVELWEEYWKQQSDHLVKTKSTFTKQLAKLNAKMNKPKAMETGYRIYVKETLAGWSKEKLVAIGSRNWMAEVAKQWRELPPEEKEDFEFRAEVSRQETNKKVIVWEEEMKAQGFPELSRDFPGNKRKALEKLLIRIGMRDPED